MLDYPGVRRDGSQSLAQRAEEQASRCTRQSRKASGSMRDRTMRFSRAYPAPEGLWYGRRATHRLPLGPGPDWRRKGADRRSFGERDAATGAQKAGLAKNQFGRQQPAVEQHLRPVQVGEDLSKSRPRWIRPASRTWASAGAISNGIGSSCQGHPCRADRHRRCRLPHFRG